MEFYKKIIFVCNISILGPSWVKRGSQIFSHGAKNSLRYSALQRLMRFSLYFDSVVNENMAIVFK